MLLNDKRRRRNIGEQYSHCKTHLQYIIRFFNTIPKLDTRLFRFPRFRLSTDKDSLKCKLENSNKTPRINSTIKIPFQPIESVRNPPNTGDATGAIPLIAPIIAIALASSLPVNRSVAIDRETTIPPAPAIPCINRKNIKPSMVAENIQHTVDTINNDMATNNGGRRPYQSLKGPKKSCLKAKPIILDVRPN